MIKAYARYDMAMEHQQRKKSYFNFTGVLTKINH